MLLSLASIFSCSHNSSSMRTALLIALVISCFFNLLPLNPAVGGGLSLSKWRRMRLGSRPPGCVNKCLSCRPCMATLVVTPHYEIKSSRSSSTSVSATLSRHGDDDDDGYYLLSWKCACGHKLFQP